MQYHEQLGEGEIQTRILDLFYLLCSHSDSDNLCDLTHSFQDLISFIHTYPPSIHKTYIQILFCLICYIRDKTGKGKRDLSYRMIYELYPHYPEYSRELLRRFVGYKEVRPYGSWKDVKIGRAHV